MYSSSSVARVEESCQSSFFWQTGVQYYPHRSTRVRSLGKHRCTPTSAWVKMRSSVYRQSSLTVASEVTTILRGGTLSSGAVLHAARAPYAPTFCAPDATYFNSLCATVDINSVLYLAAYEANAVLRVSVRRHDAVRCSPSRK